MVDLKARDREQESKWVHEFYQEHGDLLIDPRNSVVTTVLKFDTSAAVFETTFVRSGPDF